MDRDDTPALRLLATARGLLSEGQPEAATDLLARADREARDAGADAAMLSRIAHYRILCVREMPVETPPDVVWDMLDAIATDAELAGDPALLQVRRRCAVQAVVALEGSSTLSRASWEAVALWRRRLVALTPDRRHNWSALVFALLRAGDVDQAQVVLDHPDPSVADWLTETLGREARLIKLPALTEGAADGTGDVAAVRRDRAAARAVMDDGRAADAAPLFAAAEAEARRLEKKDLVASLLALRVTCATQMPPETPAETVWGMLGAIDADGFPDATRALATARAFCAMREADRLESGNSVMGVEWDVVVRWRERIAAMGPERRHNWNRMVLALIHAGREDSAREVMAHGDPEIAAFLRSTLGRTVDVLSALRRNETGIYRTEAPRYLRHGLPVVPCIGEKAIYPGWEDFADAMPDPDDLMRWMGLPYAQIGLVLGTRSGIGALDIITPDLALADRIVAALPATPWRRLGHDGITLAFRGGDAVPFRLTKNAAIVAYNDHQRLLLLPPSVQTFDGTPYTASCDLVDVLNALPELPPDVATRLEFLV